MHFARVVETYDGQAVVQQEIAGRLQKIIAEHLDNPPKHVLEIGCCTGFLTRCLVAGFPQIQKLHINDLSEEFLKITTSIELAGEIRFLAGDIEKIQLPGRYHLICSSSTFHWFHDLMAVFSKLYNHLLPGGMLAFSLYGPDNLREIRAVSGNGLDYLSLAQVKQGLLKQSFDVVLVKESLQSLVFSDPLAVQEHLRRTGVNALARPGWSRERQKKFCREYQQLFSSDKGVTLTYHPMYLVARKL